MKILNALKSSILYFIVQVFIFILLKEFIKSSVLCYLFTYIILIFYFFYKNYDNLKKDINNISFNKKVLIFSFIFTILSIISKYIIEYLIKIPATNNQSVINMFYQNKLVMGLNILLLGPITEEFIYRYQYKNCNNKISFIIYTLIFTLIHLTSSKTLIELIYIIPYLFMSLSISLQYYKNNNIFTSIIYHILNNLINIMLLLL